MSLPFCLIRKKKQLYNIPIARFTLMSPYYNDITGTQNTDINGEAITPSRLNMRRKAEILKYNSNRMPTQTNSLTKKEKWSKLVNSSGKSARLLDPESIICPGESGIRIPRPISSSASGIPGPTTYLYEDPNVPLYNLTVNRTYSYNIPNANSYWDTTVNTNVGLMSENGGTIFGLSINNNIYKPNATFAVDIPIAIYIEGTYYKQLNGLSNAITASIPTATLDVFCNGKLIPALSQTKTGMVNNMTIRLTNGNVPFKSTKHVGYLSFSGIKLETSKAYVFEFLLTVSMEVSFLNLIPEKFMNAYTMNGIPMTTNTLQHYTYANFTDIIPESSTNCVVISSSSTGGTLQKPSLIGI